MEVRQQADLGTVVDPGAGDFEIIVAEYQGVRGYGVFNKVTRIVEGFTNSLARARHMAPEFHKELVEGYQDRPQFGGALAALLGGGAPDDEPGPTRN